MGALHDGHLSLIDARGAECEEVVVSLFVNPAQFNERSDLERYPRRQERDAELAADAGARVLFAALAEEVYPPGFATTVEVLGSDRQARGRRAGLRALPGREHRRDQAALHGAPGCRLFRPEGRPAGRGHPPPGYGPQPPVRIEVCETVREPDGLAMSSRNTLLSPEERSRALALPAGAAGGLRACRGRRALCRRTAGRRRAAMLSLEVEPEYLALVDPETLEPCDTLAGESLLAVAARIGQVRLIDNAVLRPAGASAPRQPLPRKAIA